MTTEMGVTVAQERATKAARIASDLDERTAALMDVLGKSMDVERFKRVVVIAISKNPELLDCTRESIIRAVMEAAQDGLEPTGPSGGAHLVPFRNQSGVIEAVLIRDYRGLVKMALRGDVVDIEARIVYEGDLFELELGSEPFVRYIPAFARDDAKRGGYRGVYTMLRFKNPAIPPHIDYMTMAEIDKVRDSTRNKGKKGPWADWYDQMAVKTAVRSALKLRATTPELAAALELEDAVEGNLVEPPTVQVSDRRQRLIGAIAPEKAHGAPEGSQAPAEDGDGAVDVPWENAPSAAVLEAETLPALVELEAERDPTSCTSASPFDGSICTLDIDHAGVHRVGEEQSWPRS